MNEHLLEADEVAHPGYATFIKVWVALVILTGMLVITSQLGQAVAVWGLVLLSPTKAALIFYYFMHLKYEGAMLKGVVLVALATLLTFFILLFSDVAFR